MAGQSAGRVSLHPCFRQRLWTASLEITGEGGTPALFCRQVARKTEGGEEMAEPVTEQVWNGGNTKMVTFPSRKVAYSQLDAFCHDCETAFRRGSGYDIGDDCPNCDECTLSYYEAR